MGPVESAYDYLRFASQISPMSAIRPEPKIQAAGGIRAVPAASKQSNKKWFSMDVSEHGRNSCDAGLSLSA